MGIVARGDVIDGKFRVEKVLGEGGMGVVVLARHIDLGERVALKILRDGPADPGAVERFRREARAAAKLRGDHIARVTDVGWLRDQTPYFVMDYVEGRSLAAELKERGTLPVPEAADYLLQACEGIAEAHALGIVHRDLKPSNLLLERRRDGSTRLKVVDFGVAKLTIEAAPELTGSAHVLGSPTYMSPEQLRDPRDVDPRADVWSLGVVLYELLTGRVPFEAYSVSGVLARVAADPPAPLRTYAPAIEDDVEALVMRCLEKDVAKRFADVGELAEALSKHAQGGEAAAARVVRRLEAKDESGEAASTNEPLDGAPTKASAIADSAWKHEPETVSPQPSGLAHTQNTRAVAPTSRSLRTWMVALSAFVLVVAASLLITRRSQPPSAAKEPTQAAAVSHDVASASSFAPTNPTPSATATMESPAASVAMSARPSILSTPTVRPKVAGPTASAPIAKAAPPPPPTNIDDLGPRK